jgi:hypothetical protein
MIVWKSGNFQTITVRESKSEEGKLWMVVAVAFTAVGWYYLNYCFCCSDYYS